MTLPSMVVLLLLVHCPLSRADGNGTDDAEHMKGGFLQRKANRSHINQDAAGMAVSVVQSKVYYQMKHVGTGKCLYVTKDHSLILSTCPDHIPSCSTNPDYCTPPKTFTLSNTDTALAPLKQNPEATKAVVESRSWQFVGYTYTDLEPGWDGYLECGSMLLDGNPDDGHSVHWWERKTCILGRFPQNLQWNLQYYGFEAVTDDPIVFINNAATGKYLNSHGDGLTLWVSSSQDPGDKGSHPENLQWVLKQVSVPTTTATTTTTTTKTTARPRFIECQPLTNDCPHGYTEISDESVCDEAAMAIGSEYWGAHSFADSPSGCERYTLPNFQSYFNKHPSPKATSKYSAKICQAIFIELEPRTNECPGGYVEITDENVCKEAASAIGSEYYGAYGFADSPSGCERYTLPNFQTYFNKHPSPKATGKYSAKICKATRIV